MSPLEFVTPTPGPDIKNILIYGPPGTGKSTGAASAPGPILYLNTEGESRLRFARRRHGDEKIREVTVTGRATLEEAYLHLRSGKGDEKTIVLDTLGELYGVLLKEAMKDDLRSTLPEHGDVQTIIERCVRALRDLPQTVVLVAHEEQIRNETTGDLLTKPSTLVGGKKLMGKIAGMVDVIAYAAVTEDENGEPRYVAQLVPGAGRDAKTSGSFLGKVRDLDISEWIAAAAADPATTERKAA